MRSSGTKIAHKTDDDWIRWRPGVTSSNHRKAPLRLQRCASGSVLLRLSLVFLFAASLGFRSVEPCSAGHHPDLETAGAHDDLAHQAPGTPHHHSEPDSADCCCGSPSACDTRDTASLATAASQAQRSVQVPLVFSELPLPLSVVRSGSRISQERSLGPPAVPLFITLKALLI
jgi:hypothetical protein